MLLFDTAKLHRAHGQFLRALDNMLAGEMARAGEAGKREVMQHPGFKPDTGKTQKATDWRVIRTRGGKLLRLRNRGRLAHILDQGSKPHPIRSRGQWPLRFYWERKGIWVTTWKVNHPGTRPYRFLQHAANVAGHRFSGRMRDGMRMLGKRRWG